MKQVCLLCGRTTPAGDLFCQETYCPAEVSPYLLEPGEYLGDIEVVRLVSVWRSAALYVAIHQGQRVYLKIAHPGPHHKERLKREAKFLQEHQREEHQLLPRLLTPYAEIMPDAYAYGRATLRDQLLYFYLFEYVEGETLRDILLKKPQPWIYHAGWVVQELARAITYLNRKGYFHLGLSPECVLVRFDPDPPQAPRILVCDLGIASRADQITENWYSGFALPAYTPPELVGVHPSQLEYASEVYGLGVMLHELLIGQPAFPYRLRDDRTVEHAIQHHQPIALKRGDLADEAINLAQQATDLYIARRQPDAAVLAKQLKAIFKPVPPLKKRRWPNSDTMLLIVSAALTVAFLIALAVSLNEFAFHPNGL
jgi:serine/threonine protein kinase